MSNFLVGAGAARCGCGNGVVAGTELGLAVCFEGDGSAGRALIGDRACPCPWEAVLNASRRRVVGGEGSRGECCWRDETCGFRSPSDMIDALRT